MDVFDLKVDYIAISEHEDEGDYFLFQLPDNKIVYVGGQEFSPATLFRAAKFGYKVLINYF
jgi:hypothetical protein